MPPSARLTKEQIAKTAFEILRKEGYDALNARRLATELGVSTMPLFKHYESMNEIKSAAVRLGVEEYSKYMRSGVDDPIPFKGIGRAYIRFAKNEPKLFEIFYMRPTESVSGLDNVDPNIDVALDMASNILKGNTSGGEKLLRDMWIVVHGIATLEATGKMSFSEEETGDILSNIFLGLKKQYEGDIYE